MIILILFVVLILCLVLSKTLDLLTVLLPPVPKHTQFKLDRFNFKCYILSLPKRIDRRKTFLKYFNTSLDHEIVYGVNTNIITNAIQFKDRIDPEYLKVALQLKQGTIKTRPNITFFNLGAIGCYMGHYEIYRKAIRENQKYILIFEDNCIVKSDEFYFEVQNAIKDLGDTFDFCWFHTHANIYSKDQPYKNDPVLKIYKKLDWLMGTKCYLVNVGTLGKCVGVLDIMDNHIDMKMEDIVSKGTRIYYKKSKHLLVQHTNSNGVVSSIVHSPYDLWFSRFNLPEPIYSKYLRFMSNIYLTFGRFGLLKQNDINFNGFINFMNILT